jgi:hypothetical protein
MKYSMLSAFLLCTTAYVTPNIPEDVYVDEATEEECDVKSMPDSPVIDFFTRDCTITENAEDFIELRSDTQKIQASKNVRSSNIVGYAQRFCARHHKDTIPDDRRKKINKILTNVCALVQKNLVENNIPEINQRMLDFVFKTAVGNLLAQDLSKEVLYKLWEHVYQAIVTFFAHHKMHPHLVPDELKEEYKQVQSTIMNKLIATMQKRRKDSISQDEIDAAVRLVMESFVERMERILIGHVVAADLTHIYQAEEGKPLSSSITPNPQSKDLYERFAFLNNKPIDLRDVTIPELPPLAGQ